LSHPLPPPGSELKETASATPRHVPQSSAAGANPFEGAKAAEEEEEEEAAAEGEEEEGFMDLEPSYPAAEESGEGDSFSLYPSRADDALKTCKPLAQHTADTVWSHMRSTCRVVVLFRSRPISPEM